jgi:hypothetical protein
VRERRQDLDGIATYENLDVGIRGSLGPGVPGRKVPLLVTQINSVPRKYKRAHGRRVRFHPAVYDFSDCQCKYSCVVELLANCYCCITMVRGGISGRLSLTCRIEHRQRRTIQC